MTANPNGGCPIFEKEVSIEAFDNYDYLITLDPRDTANLDVNKKYWYDVSIQSGTEYYNVIEFSPFNIIANASLYKRSIN